MTDPAELERLGLVAPPEELAPLHVSPARSISGSNRKWPSYELCLERAPLKPKLARPKPARCIGRILPGA